MKYRYIFIIYSFFINITTSANTNELNGKSGVYAYEKRQINSNNIHIVTINPKDYGIEIIKANSSDSKSSVGRETVSSIATRSHAEIAINAGFFEIGKNKDGMPTGTLIINGKKYNVINKTQSLVVIDSGTMTIDSANPKKYLSANIANISNISMVSGIPLLVHNGNIVHGITKKNSDFYTKPHARTAIGITYNGDIIILVAESHYRMDLIALATGKFELDVQGLTIPELAQLMKDLGCKDAINLDGGGSSSLWIKNKIVNKSIGDKDESEGLQVYRPVSDVIVFKKH